MTRLVWRADQAGMVRRSSARAPQDDRAFPIRVLVRNPVGDTLQLRFTDAQAWLNDNIGRGEWAMHCQSKIGLHAMGLYFRSLADAVRFFEAHPRFELEDRTHMVQHILEARRSSGLGAPHHTTGFDSRT